MEVKNKWLDVNQYALVVLIYALVDAVGLVRVVQAVVYQRQKKQADRNKVTVVVVLVDHQEVEEVVPQLAVDHVKSVAMWQWRPYMDLVKAVGDVEIVAFV